MREVIEGAGGLVVVIPHSADPESWQAAYELVDAVVMMGGPDVSAEAYGATPHPLTRARSRGHRHHGARPRARLPAGRQAGARHLPRQPGAQRRRGRHARAGRALDGHVPACTCGEWVRVVEDPPSCSTRSRCSRAPGSPTGSEPARTSSTPTTTRRSSGSARGCAPRGGAGRHDRGGRVRQRRLRPRPAVAQRVPHARRRALRAPAAGARRAPRRALRDGRRPGRPPPDRVTSASPGASARRRRPGRTRR